MKKKQKGIGLLLNLFFIGIFLTSLNNLNINSINSDLNSPSDIIKEDSEVLLSSDSAGGTEQDPILENYGGYSTPNVANFDIIENASSIITERDYWANGSNYFNTSTPENWNITSKQFEIESYSKEQKIQDPEIDDPYHLDWEDDYYNNGEGEINLNFLPNDDNPDYFQLNLFNEKERTSPGFYKGDYGYMTQNLININPNGFNIQEGEKIQNKDTTIENFDDFDLEPVFTPDDQNPYGGTIRPGDQVDLLWDGGFLMTQIRPYISMGGGNPSAGWWHYIDIPYNVDYAQITITWAIYDYGASHFEANDYYQVFSRINNRNIDDSLLIYKDDDLPGSGGFDSLITYNDPMKLSHDFISRTYNITSLIDGLVGINKIDFGAWAHNPSHGGDADYIFVLFDSIEIMYNASDKYEIATLDFDYKAIDNRLASLPDGGGDNTDPDAIINRASVGLELEDLSGSENIQKISILPFSKLIINDTVPPTPNHVSYSIPQKYKEFLKNNDLTFKLGVFFDQDFYDAIDLDIQFDNVYFNINYEHTNVSISKLIMKMDNGNWEQVKNNSLTVNTTSWTGGENHTFLFNTTSIKYKDNLYLNLKSNLNINFTNLIPNGAFAKYDIVTANSRKGQWNITFNNSFSYSKLLFLNSTPYFNISSYSISYIDLPAFDLKGDNSDNWNIFSAIAPDYSNYSQNLIRFNYTIDPSNQSATINNAFKSGNWTLIAQQINYINNCTFNSTFFYVDTPAYYVNEVLKYNITLEEGSLNGNYSLAVLNSTGDTLASYPLFYTSATQEILGTIDITPSFDIGQYYIYIKWNDTANTPGRTLRFGSIVKSFFILNSTIIEFIETTSSLDSGDIANFTIYYRTYNDWGIENAIIDVLENSTGNWKTWGEAWTGSSLIGTITPLGDGNYSIPLLTTGANGNYTLKFTCYKLYHQPLNLTTNLEVITINYLEISITYGAYLNPQSQYVLNDTNFPYVNDTTNSIVQLNITDKNTKLPIEGGLITGVIGDSLNYFQALDINGGLYNLTLDTTGFNATVGNENETLYIKCSASNYSYKETNITIFINEIPTDITLQNIDPVYAQGEISILATMFKVSDPINPEPNNYGTLNYYIYQGTSQKLNGSLIFLMSGVYTSDILLTGLSAGEYTIYVNGTALNCENDQSNVVNLTILAQDPTELEITVPTTIRILKEFQIKNTLSYSINGTKISSQTIYLNITIGSEDPVIIATLTDLQGESTYDYIISEENEDENIKIKAIYNGQTSIAACEENITKLIEGKMPITLNITEHPNNTARVGYSVTYQVKIDINGESVQNRIIIFNAYYEYSNISTPFLTQQLYTDSDGECGYTIPEIADGYDNLSVFFEYLGSTTITYNITNRTDSILPKWNSTFSYDILDEDDDGVLRYGEKIIFNMTFWSENITAPPFSGISVIFTFKYGTKTEIYIEYVSGNNTLMFSYKIPDQFSGDINMTIDFQGSNKISNKIINSTIDVQDKIKVVLEFIEKPKKQYMVGNQFISIKATAEDGTPLRNFKLIFEILDSDGNVIDSATASTNDEGIASTSLNFGELGEEFTINVRFEIEGFYESSVLTSEDIRVINEFILFLDFLPYLLIGIAIFSSVSYSIYRGIVIPKRNRKRELLKIMYQKLSDVENLQYIIVLTKEGGVPIFSKSLADVPIDGTLISGFLSAISTFGAEIGAKMKDKEGEGGLEELSYRQFKIILNQGITTTTALLLLKRPSATLKSKLKLFNNVFEEAFNEVLVNWSGEVLRENMVDPLIEEVFEADLLYPHHLIENKVKDYIKDLDKRDLTRKMIIIAKSEEFESNFYLRDMINHLKTKGIEEVNSFESLETLKMDRVVFAINPRTNYLIEQLLPYFKSLNTDDRSILFAIFEGVTDEIGIRKYLKKQRISLSGSADIQEILQKLREMNLIDVYNIINETGNAIATILKLIPDI